MKRYDTPEIRNVALISHGGHGSTSLGEAFLFASGAVNRLGRVDDGNAILDFDDEEKERKSSTAAGVAFCEHKKHKINIVDLPGLADFVGDIDGGLRAVDSAVLVVEAVGGVQVRSERLWSRAEALKLPRIIFINKMDRERASYERTVEDIRTTLGVKPVPFTIPIGAEGKFRGVVDVLARKAFIYPMDGSAKLEVTDIPSELAAEASSLREALVEELAGTDESLMERYFEEGDLDDETLGQALVKAVRTGFIVPLFVGAATAVAGVHSLLDFIVTACPSPADRETPQGVKPGTETAVSFPCRDDAPFSAYVFKTIKDKFGQLSVFRIVSGSVERDTNVHNANKGSTERLGALAALRGRDQTAIDGACAGDIVAVAKLKDTGTGDTLCSEAAPIQYPGVPRSYPAMTLAILATKQGDEDKIFQRLIELSEEDPSLQVTRDKLSGTLLSGMGQLHIDATIKKLRRKFGIDAQTADPKIAYRETIKGMVKDVRYRHKKQTGGKGQFAEVIIDIGPNERGGGFVFDDAIVGGVVPRQFIPAVEKGIVELMTRGVIAGYEVVDMKVRLHDGKYHDVDSSEMAFKIAGSMAFKAAMRDPKAKACLLEPIVEMEITVPEEAMGDVMGDLSSRRGRPMGMEAKGKYQTIKAQVPQAEVLRYSPDLRSMTGGRGDFVMRFSHYEEVPRELADKIIAAYTDDSEE